MSKLADGHFNVSPTGTSYLKNLIEWVFFILSMDLITDGRVIGYIRRISRMVSIALAGLRSMTGQASRFEIPVLRDIYCVVFFISESKLVNICMCVYYFVYPREISKYFRFH